jgi:hypothetical protein
MLPPFLLATFSIAAANSDGACFSVISLSRKKSGMTTALISSETPFKTVSNSSKQVFTVKPSSTVFSRKA